MPYAIMRFAKRKGGAIGSMEAHNERKKNVYKSNPDIEVNRSTDYEIKSRIEQKGCKVRRDSVLMVETLITASPVFMNALPAEEQREYFMRAVRFIQEEVGEDNVFAATVHMDEKTPHMHICFTPITPDGKLSAKIVLGNQKKLSDWQTKFHEYMSSRWNELERGVSAIKTQRKHIPVWLFKKAQRLDTQFQEVQQALSDITFLNAGKKRDEAISLLKNWIPEAEKFTAQAKNTQGYINKLEFNNLSLQGKLRAKDEKINEAWDKAFQFKKVTDRQKRLLDKVPKEVLEQIETAKAKRRER